MVTKENDDYDRIQFYCTVQYSIVVGWENGDEENEDWDGRMKEEEEQESSSSG